MPPAAFELDGARHEVASWRQLLRVLCAYLASQTGPAFAERVTEVRGRERPYFSASGAGLREPLEIPGADLHVEGNLNAKNCRDLARRVLVAVRGSDDGFQIELAQ